MTIFKDLCRVNLSNTRAGVWYKVRGGKIIAQCPLTAALRNRLGDTIFLQCQHDKRVALEYALALVAPVMNLKVPYKRTLRVPVYEVVAMLCDENCDEAKRVLRNMFPGDQDLDAYIGKVERHFHEVSDVAAD